jgi:RHS repeat-associated protein
MGKGFNLPNHIEFDGAGKRIYYIYNALGEKIKKIISKGAPTYTSVATEYLNGYHYEGGDLKFFPTAEGYVNVTEGLMIIGGGRSKSYSYVYNYTDHLGNVRLSYTRQTSRSQPIPITTILEENHYYPFGLKHKKYGSTVKDFVVIDEETEEGYYVGIDILPPQARKTYQYKYNGKEYQDELGLGFYDFGFRNYDPAIGRWMNIDPLAEKSRRWTPYNYGYNNPMRFVDPDGMLSQDAIDEMWRKSKDREETKWVNDGTGTFTHGSDKVVAASDEADDGSGDNGGGDKKKDIVKNAKSKDKSTEYSYETSKDDFEADTNKCNKFVYDILKKSGVNPPLPNGNLIKKMFGFGSPITAGQWADPNYHIQDWEIVSSLQAGDVVAITGNFLNATGHVTIMISTTESMGAGHSEAHVTDFGSNKSHYSNYPGNSGYVYRRYVGGAGGTSVPKTYVNPAYKQYP